MFIKRRIDEIIEGIKNKFPILAITGLRQSGKTTLLKQIFPEYRYISLEDPNTRLYSIERSILRYSIVTMWKPMLKKM